MKRFGLVSGFALFLLVVAPPLASAASITFSDSTFSDGNWSAFELMDTTPGNTYSFAGSQQATGGNPGQYRQVINDSVSLPSENVSLAAGHLFASGIFDPGEDGTFASLDFAFDGISVGSTAGAVAYRLLAVQNGRHFIAGFIVAINGQGWLSLAETGLTGTEFAEVLPGAVFTSDDPDFSNAGAPVQFGFFTSNGTFGESHNVGGVDNWTVTVHTQEATSVPEPGTALLLLAGLGLSAAASRRARLITARA